MDVPGRPILSVQNRLKSCDHRLSVAENAGDFLVGTVVTEMSNTGSFRDISDDNMSTSGNGELDLEIPHMHVDVDESLVQQLVRSANSIDNPAKYFAEFFIKVFPVGEEGHKKEHVAVRLIGMKSKKELCSSGMSIFDEILSPYNCVAGRCCFGDEIGKKQFYTCGHHHYVCNYHFRSKSCAQCEGSGHLYDRNHTAHFPVKSIFDY